MTTTDGLVFNDIVSILNFAEDGRVNIGRDLVWHGYPMDEWEKASAWDDVRKEANAGTIGFKIATGGKHELFLATQPGLRKFHTRTHWCYYVFRFTRMKTKAPPVCPNLVEWQQLVNIDGIRYTRARWQEYRKKEGGKVTVEGFEMLPGDVDRLGIQIRCPFDPQPA